MALHLGNIFLWKHLVVAEADVLEVLIKFFFTSILNVFTKALEEAQDNGVVAPLDVQGRPEFSTLILVCVVWVIWYI